MRFLGICIALMLSLAAFAQHDLGDGVRVTDSQLHELKTRLPKLGSEKKFYHWTKEDVALRWALQGYLDRGEVNFYNQETGSRQVHGAGVYMAETASSSTSFGSTAVVFLMEAGTILYDEAVIREVLGKNLNNSQKTKLGQLLPFVRKVNSRGWFITHHPETLKRIEWGGLHEANPQWSKTNLNKLFEKLYEVGRTNNGAMYLESLFHLSEYMDGISFLRAYKVATSNPWGEFEPQHFEKYRSARQEYSQRAHSGEDLGVVHNEKFGGQGMSQSEYVEKQLNQIFPELFEKISGGSSGNMYRGEGVRAGGNQQGRTFHASEAQLQVLRANPYLTVEAAPHPSGRGYLVHYFYPDVFHYEGIKELLSKELINKIKKAGAQGLWNNNQLRQQLNQQMMRELLTELFTRMHGKSASPNALHGIKAYQDLVSIHPFRDFNGRTSRFYFEVIGYSIGKPAGYHFLADLDLMLEAQKYKEVVQSGTKQHQALFEAMLSELFRAKVEGRMPAYRDLPEWNAFKKALSPIGVELPENLSQAEYELIRRRRFFELFESLVPDAELGGNCKTLF